ncbi:MAG: TraR/DksA C4-type zinc finger protein, partial [Xanthobacteraceae bacterium]
PRRTANLLISVIKSAKRTRSKTLRKLTSWETGEPITLKRLEARPIATLSIEAQKRHESRERAYRDD